MSGSGGGTDARRGGGFLAGALTGLAVSVVGLAAWSLNAPLAPEAAAPSAPPAAAANAAKEAAPPAGPAPNAATPETTPAVRSEPAPAPAEAAPVVVAEPVAQSVAKPAAQSAAEPAPDPAAEAAAARAPENLAPPAPPEPAWRRNAEAFDARGAAPVAVALTGIESALLDRALGLGAPLTLVVDAAAPNASALVARARAAGCEVVSLGPAADPRAVGVAAPEFDARARAAAGEAGWLALALTPGEAVRPADAPAATVMFRLDGDASAARVFQTLQEAARRAAPGAGVVVALEGSDAALTALARWLAVTDAAPAPLSAVAAGR